MVFNSATRQQGRRPAPSRACALLILGATGLAPVPAFAQIGPGQTSQNALPSREQVQPPLPQVAPNSQVQVDGNRAFREVACPFETVEGRVAIRRVVYRTAEGGELHPALRRALASVPIAQGDQPLSSICDIRDNANSALRKQGYVASVQIPPQEITDGTLSLTVLTARLVDVQVVARHSPYAKLLGARAEQLKALEPFNQFEAERILLLAGDIPGLDVQLSLSPYGSTPGDVAGTLSVAYTPAALIDNVQNYGSRSIGRITGYARGELYGLTGLGDVTFVGVSTTFNEEQQVLQFGHGLALDADGTRLDGSITYAWSRPDLGGIDIRSESLVGTVAVSAPFVRAPLRNFNISAGLDFIEQRTSFHFDGLAIPLSEDRLRVGFVRVAGNLTRPDPHGHGYGLSGGIELRQGLNLPGASHRYRLNQTGAPPSRVFGDPEATVVRLDLDSQLGLGSIFTLGTSLRAQKSSAALLNYEQFSVGSLTVGRGYDPGAVSGDSALAARNELRAAVYRGRTLGVEVYGFFDYAWLWNRPQRDLLTGEAFRSPDDHRLLRSTGVGARLSLPGNLFLDAAWARPLDHAPLRDSARPRGRLLFSITSQFSPSSR